MLAEKDLHKYQLACVEHIISHPYCGVFLEMGLGKTLQVIAMLDSIRDKNKTSLVVCPASLITSQIL